MRHRRTVIAAAAAAIWLLEPGWPDAQTELQETSQEQCLSTPNSDCLAELVIPAAKARDSPGTRLQGIAEVLLLRGEREYAGQLLGAAVKIGFEGFSTKTGFGANSDLWTVSRISRLLNLLNENGFRELQLEVIELLEDFLEQDQGSNAREDALYLVFIALLNLGEVDDALSTADRMSRSASRWAMYGDVAVAEAVAGRTDEALATVDKVGNRTFLVKAKARVAAVLAEQGRIELAKDVLPDQASDIEVNNAHKAIASALVANGQVEEALSYAHAISGTFQRAFVQDSLSGVLAEAGELEAAVALAKSISIRQQRAQALATVGEALVAGGEIELARDVLAEMPRTALWQDPVDESIEEARARLERALVNASRQ